MRGVGKSEIIGDLVDRLVGEYKLSLGFGENALPDEVARGDAGRPLDMVIETVGRHRQLLGIKADEPLLAEMFVDEAAQFVDAGVVSRQRHRAAACPAYRQ